MGCRGLWVPVGACGCLGVCVCPREGWSPETVAMGRGPEDRTTSDEGWLPPKDQTSLGTAGPGVGLSWPRMRHHQDLSAFMSVA